MNNKEQKTEEQINHTMQSIEGMQRAKANPFLYEKVMARINDNSALPESNWNPAANIKYAVVIIAFIILNIFTIAQFSGDKSQVQGNTSNSNATSSKEVFEKEYFESSSNNYGY